MAGSRRTRRSRGSVVQDERDVHGVDSESTESMRNNRSGMWGKEGTEIDDGCMSVVPLLWKRRLCDHPLPDATSQ